MSGCVALTLYFFRGVVVVVKFGVDMVKVVVLVVVLVMVPVVVVVVVVDIFW